MNQKEIYQKIEDLNVKTTAQDLEFQCMQYHGQHNHKAHGTFRQHFMFYRLGRNEVEFDTDITYKELRKKFPDAYRKHINVISECLERGIIRI